MQREKLSRLTWRDKIASWRSLLSPLLLLALLIGVASYSKPAIIQADTAHSALQLYTEKDGLPDRVVNCLAYDKRGYLWAGTNNGAAFYNGRHWQMLAMPAQPAANRVHTMLAMLDGSIWFGTDGGLFRYQNNSWQEFLAGSSPLPINKITALAIAQGKDDAIWIGTTQGLARYQTGQWTIFNSDNSDLPDNLVLSLRETPDSQGKYFLWVGTEKGLACLTQDRWLLFNQANSALPANRINSLTDSSIEAGRNMLWIGTPAGIAKLIYREQKADWQIFTNQTTPALPDNSVDRLARDRGSIYAVTEKGIALIRYSKGAYKIENISIANQLITNYSPGGLIISYGRIWVATNAGLLALDISEDYYKRAASPLYVERILINGSQYKTDDASAFDNIVLSHDQNNVAFEFALLSYFREEATRYQVQLIGYDEQPLEWSSEGRKEYTNLSPGEYTFNLWGKDFAGNISGPVKIPFRVKYAPWRSWWAYICYITMVGAIGYGGLRFQLSRLQRSTDELRRLVNERTAEIMQQRDEIGRKNNRILDSIRYAERIQQAMLPTAEWVEQAIPEHFIIFKPKDIVSGDFYWVQETKGVLIVAVGDCTGHGVPGAFMSMIGNQLLNQIILEKHITDPATILEYLHTGIRRALKQNELDTDSLDGMDIALCRIDLKIGSVIFAGARRPLYYIDADGKLNEIKGDRKTIGGKQSDVRHIYTPHRINIGDHLMLYLATDGFVDQNGSGRAKFGTRKLKELLQSIGHLELKEQEQALLQVLHEHQGDELQRDDITIFGIRISD